ncbi:hypothetical protein [uncultured Weeksella sp.]|nr:hypothetical protein [uncultured Weeksella sp.]
MKRKEFADLIVEKIEQNKKSIKQQYDQSKDSIGYFWVDDLLPEEWAMQINEKFPTKDKMVLKKSLKEDKYIAVQMNEYDPILEEIIYAFQDKRIVDLIAEICEIK